MNRNSVVRLLPLICMSAGSIFAAPARAADSYKVDGTHSSVIFRIKHLGVSYFYGRFTDVSGTCVFDESDPTNSSIQIAIQTESIDTNDQKRDAHLKSPDFFNVRQFPTITFQSTKIKLAGEDKLDVSGNLTFHGVTKPIVISVERTGTGPDPWGGHRTGFETTLTIKRSDFGMDYMLSGLGDEVKLIVSIESVRK